LGRNTRFLLALNINTKTSKTLKKIPITTNSTNKPPANIPSFQPSPRLLDEDESEDAMDIDDNMTPLPDTTSRKKVTWSTDTGITSLSENIFSHMVEQKQKAADAGDLEDDAPAYKKPEAHVDSNEKLNQRIRFNLIRHRGMVADTKVGTLFKSFASTLKRQTLHWSFTPSKPRNSITRLLPP